MGVKRPRPAAVLIPLLPNGNSYDVLFEVRSAGIAQPGDICFPGGTMEPGETPEVAAVRETTEELLVSREQIRVLRTMNTRPGPKGRPLEFSAFWKITRAVFPRQRWTMCLHYRLGN